MNPDDSDRVLIVGAGAIGRQIAVQSALAGYRVTLNDVSGEALRSAAAACPQVLTDLTHRRELTAEQVSQTLARIRPVLDPQRAAADADLLIESVPEQLQVKREVFARFAEFCPPQTVFSTNTSMLLPSMLAASTGRPDRFAALHFIMESDIIEIMPHPGTSPETLAFLDAFARRLAGVTLVCRREQPGYLVNSMLMALNATALTLVVNGVTSPEDVDRAWMKAVNVDRGPFGILDVVGIDTAWQVTDYGARWINDSQAKKNAQFLKAYVDRGELGVKTGRGFYTYPDPAYRRPGFLEGD